MCYPERSMQYHPRNKNMVLGMLLEAVYYSQVNKAKIDDSLLAALRDVVEHCTGCGRCTANCPVKIPSGDVALTLRALLEREGAGGHPVKEKALEWLVRAPEIRVPKAAKMASLGQKMQNNMLGFVPEGLKKRFASPMFSGKGPKMGYTNLYESLRLGRGYVFAPAEPQAGMPAVLYFPGCGGALFYDRIGQASLMLLLKAGFAVIVPPKHLCCGYALLAAGMETQYNDNLAQVKQQLAELVRQWTKQGFVIKHLVTACGSCRDSLERSGLVEQFPDMTQTDVGQLVLPLLPQESIAFPHEAGSSIVYHASCHAEWANVHKIKARTLLAHAIQNFSNVQVQLNSGCCGESGMGSITSPQIYNVLRDRKRINLEAAFAQGYAGPVVVGCPSCKIGIGRNLLRMKDKRPVLHLTEWLAELLGGAEWRTEFRRKIKGTRGDVRVVSL